MGFSLAYAPTVQTSYKENINSAKRHGSITCCIILPRGSGSLDTLRCCEGVWSGGMVKVGSPGFGQLEDAGNISILLERRMIKI
jgi:hypothetical protein